MNDDLMRMFFAKTAIRCLHGKPPQAAEYSRGLSRASTCVSLLIEYRVKDELCPPCIHGLARARRPSPNLRSLRKSILLRPFEHSKEL
jgi:hypothetical protein